MKKIRELLSSDHVSSDEEWGIRKNRPHRRPRDARKEDKKGKRQ